MRFKDGYNTLIEEGGALISGGQRQRLSILRAIISDSPFIIIDEGFSAIGDDLAQKIINNLQECLHNKTVLYISHNKKLDFQVNKYITISNLAISQTPAYHCVS